MQLQQESGEMDRQPVLNMTPTWHAGVLRYTHGPYSDPISQDSHSTPHHSRDNGHDLDAAAGAEHLLGCQHIQRADGTALNLADDQVVG